MDSVLWDLSLLLELLITDWRDVAVNPDFRGNIFIFGRGVTRKILDRIF